MFTNGRVIPSRERRRADQRIAVMVELVRSSARRARALHERALQAEAEARELRAAQAELLDLLDHHGPRTREVTVTIRYPA